MADQEARQRVKEDPSTCPFCGNEEYADPCDHLLADFADGSDGDGGVLGGGWATDNVVTEPARELGRACRDLLLAVWRDDEWEDRIEKLKGLTAHRQETWWAEAVDNIEGNDDCTDDDEGLGCYATPIVTEIIEDVPGVFVGETILGGMTSSLVWFLWADNREAGRSALKDKIGEATKSVRLVQTQLS